MEIPPITTAQPLIPGFTYVLKFKGRLSRARRDEISEALKPLQILSKCFFLVTDDEFEVVGPVPPATAAPVQEPDQV